MTNADSNFDVDVRDERIHLDEDRFWFEKMGPEWFEFSTPGEVLGYRPPIPIGFTIESTEYNTHVETLSNYFSGPGRAGRWSMVAAGVVIALMIVATAIAVVLKPPEPTALNNPINALIIPGLNEFMPLWTLMYVGPALLFTAAVHELGHGIAARNHDIPLVSTGVGTLLVLPAAFVKLPEDWEEYASPRARLDVAIAGVWYNTYFGFISVWLLLIYAYMTGGAWISGTIYEYQILNPVAGFLLFSTILNFGIGFTQLMPVKYLDGHLALTSLAELVLHRIGIKNAGERSESVGRASHYVMVVSVTAFYTIPWIVA